MGAASGELKRDWFFTPGAEWMVWECPHTGKWRAFRVILGEARKFLEWREGEGFVAGASDEGERPGRAKMTAVLEARRGTEAEVGALVLGIIRKLKAEPPVVNGARVQLPKGLLDFIADLIEHMPRS